MTPNSAAVAAAAASFPPNLSQSIVVAGNSSISPPSRFSIGQMCAGRAPTAWRCIRRHSLRLAHDSARLSLSSRNKIKVYKKESAAMCAVPFFLFFLFLLYTAGRSCASFGQDRKGRGEKLVAFCFLPLFFFLLSPQYFYFTFSKENSGRSLQLFWHSRVCIAVSFLNVCMLVGVCVCRVCLYVERESIYGTTTGCAQCINVVPLFFLLYLVFYHPRQSILI